MQCEGGERERERERGASVTFIQCQELAQDAVELEQERLDGARSPDLSSASCINKTQVFRITPGEDDERGGMGGGGI